MQNEKIDLIQCENNSSYAAALHVQLFPPRQQCAGAGGLCVPGRLEFRLIEHD